MFGATLTITAFKSEKTSSSAGEIQAQSSQNVTALAYIGVLSLLQLTRKPTILPRALFSWLRIDLVSLFSSHLQHTRKTPKFSRNYSSQSSCYPCFRVRQPVFAFATNRETAHKRSSSCISPNLDLASVPRNPSSERQFHRASRTIPGELWRRSATPHPSSF
ncbi:hypothetical protein BJ508DRAFT_72526 [Ascobolus immersus RN42]|uniref:Uncharacterized protein n=1 Tax=Ascobolus immersus RN42 TaxID=1160509 RepID=A0A3N4HGB4_ASCIM|nr:hypothetical protein BJ508DRAFT_72526 [Ascobolus immersus RN42]